MSAHDDSFRTIIRSQSDLHEVWRHLMGVGGFSEPSVWMLLIEDDVPIPRILEIAESDTLPTVEQAEGFVELLRSLSADLVGRVRLAFLCSRPGPSRLLPEDRDWARFLLHSCREAGVAGDVVHVATGGGVFPVPPDDLLVSA